MNQARSSQATLEILKEAILLERRGHAFYKKVAGQADDAAVKEFFEMMSLEELEHIKILEAQFSSFARHKSFNHVAPGPALGAPQAKHVLNAAIRERIAAAGFEAAAISAAMLMEERAIALYSQRAAAAKDPAEEALYRWLAQWERTHLDYLVALDKEIKETIWNDQHFWPF